MRYIRSFVFGYWPLILAVGMLGSLVAVLSIGYQAVIYPLFLQLPLIQLVLACGVFPVVGLMVLISWLRKTRVVKGAINFTAILLLVPSAFCALVVFTVAVFYRDDFRHLDSTKLNGHVYQLTGRYEYDAMGAGWYLLYECDGTGRFCSLAYETSERFYIRHARLITYPATNTISIEVDGEIVYTYHPDD